ncbi:KTSC domain-containing protein [Candidatus Pacearchaeota archaeon]|nr:KTSC domain-containing protein [Candidatus Pacearchaeota archaeon]
MEMIDVQSSNLSQVGYDAETQTLGIVFKSGVLYHYENVPQEVFDELIEASSAGRYFNTQIRNSFSCTKES